LSTDADRVIQALQAGFDDLAGLVRSLTPDQLTGPSAAAQWDVSQVLSHLGSGSVIALATLDAALAGRPTPGTDANREIWARWDAMSPQERADGFLSANADLMARYDSLDPHTRESLRIDLGYLPEPVDVAAAARSRLAEFALHSWDVRVAFDPAAVLRPDAAAELLGWARFMLGWLAKPAAAVPGRTVTLLVTLHDPDDSFGLTLGEAASVHEAPAEPDGALTAPAEAWLRLLSGRLAPNHTPSDVEVTGDLTLDTLRQVFPGY
jgi:uncharacterized protein (TIGR03083 family)